MKTKPRFHTHTRPLVLSKPMEKDHTTQPTKKRRIDDTLKPTPSPSHDNDQEDVIMDEQNQHCSKDDNGPVLNQTNLMSSSSASSSPKILTSILLEQVHPDQSLASDAELFVNQVATTIVAAVKMSKVEEKIFTLPIVKSCIAGCLQGCGELLKHAESEGSKASQKFVSPEICTTRADQLKQMEEYQNKELEKMEKDFKNALAEKKITQQ